MPKVSVIIPVYNTEAYLTECIESVLTQTLQDIEIICIDDGSTDHSIEILSHYAQKDNRIKIIQQANQGAGACRNKGLEVASGETIYFLDSDDLLVPTALEKMYKQLEKTQADICVCKRYILEPSTRETTCDDDSLNLSLLPPQETFSPQDIATNLYQFCIIGIFIKLYRKSFLDQTAIRFQEIKTTNDVFFNHATLALARRITYLNEPLVIYRTSRPNCLTGQRGYSLTCVKTAYNAAVELLIKRDLYKAFHDSLYQRALQSFLYEIQLCPDPLLAQDMVKEMRAFIPENYWRKQMELDQELHLSWLQKIFSITNHNEQRCVTILGLTLRFKKKQVPLKKLIGKKDYLKFRSFPDMARVIRRHIRQIPQDIDLIVGVPRSGMIPAYMIALFLNKKVCSLPEFLAGILRVTAYVISPRFQ